ncbi:hydrogenase nickel incorporation protein HypB [bacterium]|nr:MAG: hydrogenase nickel incorporation protein HypB [bacterium]
MSLITLERKVLEKNDVIAQTIRNRLREKNIFAINLLSSPGSGKTSLVERTIYHLKNKVKISVIEGDVQTDLDAQRINVLDIPVVQIVTNGACHLEAALVRDAFDQLDISDTQMLIIENVGNLVCPAGYDLGETTKVVVLSTTEGDDKPLKYPAMFRNASVLIINKTDLLPYLPCNIETMKTNARSINPSLTIFETSCTTDKGMAEWCSWLESQIKK